MENYINPTEAAKILKICKQTLKRYEKDGLIETIRTPGGKRMYNVEKYLIENNLIHVKENSKRKICYCRVSTNSQKDDLERQIKLMQEKYPTYEIIKDIGSGLNFKRTGLKKIIKMSINNEIDEIVLAYKDRLCRFGYDLIEMLVKDYSNGKITIINSCNESPQQELTKDLVSIINVFSAKLNGMRTYK
tara:strand:- start:83 stop:649 length:567 start_codon:yes stop_codon:yes gene_type:complete